MGSQKTQHKAKEQGVQPKPSADVQKAQDLLHCAQTYYEAKKIDLALEASKKSMAQKNLNMGLKLKIANLIGLCYRHQSCHREVYLQLKKWIKYTKQYSSESFSFEIYCNYIEALMALDLKKEALEHFEDYALFLRKRKDDVVWAESYLIVRHLRYIFAKKYESPKEAWNILLSIRALAVFVGDKAMAHSMKEEMKLYDFEQGQVSHFQDWVYLKEDKLALFEGEKRLVRLDKNLGAQKAIELLLPSPIKTETFFKAVTKTSYNHALHEKTLLQILSKIRSTLSPSSVAIQGEYVGLI
ncbi:MAG: hypothetical protein OXB88_05735 [Bacteriovoracales bacterium]|nr:hypothetical protein [Bacteriovoracales bacterium]